MREHGKRWLISRMKTSGSRRRYVINGSFSEERSRNKRVDLDSLPKRESFKQSSQFYNGKINYGLLVRFLNTQVGQDWDSVYSEIMSRIPTKLLPHKDMVYWFVADKVEIIEGRIWNKSTHKFIGTDSYWKPNVEYKQFYVCPDTNKLIKIPDFPRRIAKKA
jgi:hypothetical protein